MNEFIDAYGTEIAAFIAGLIVSAFAYLFRKVEAYIEKTENKLDDKILSAVKEAMKKK